MLSLLRELHMLPTKEPKLLRKKHLALKARLQRYGLTWEDFERMRRAQVDRCWICDEPFLEENEINIDHCHRTEKVRGLLCQHCNHGLGHFKDKVSNLLRAVVYLDPGHEIAGLLGTGVCERPNDQI